MVEAYISIRTGAGMSESVVEHLRTLDAVNRASIVAGDIDIVAEVEADSEHELLELLSEEIHPLEGVGGTRTCIVLG
jgi:DNA-binding Lrp family transcriptional regulator